MMILEPRYGDGVGTDFLSGLREENAALRQEIRVAHQAAEITARLVVEQFVKTDAILTQFQTTSSQLQAVLDAASRISIIATDLQGAITLFNRGAEHLLGYRAEEVVGRYTPLDFHMPEELAVRTTEVAAACNNVLQGMALFAYYADMGGSGILEWTYRRKDGSLVPVSLSITPLLGPDRVPVGYLGVAMDITPVKEAQERLHRANAELEAANRDLQKLDQLKSELLSSVSHELRTPLTSIRGFTQLIRREFERTFAPLAGEDDKLKRKGERIQENLDIILTESERLTRLINDVLDLAKIESGRAQWNDAPFPFHDAVAQAVNAVRGQFAEKTQVALHVALDPVLWEITADRDRLVQVMVNILNNAAKFTDRGEVRVVLGEEAPGWLRLDVIDTGRGFAAEDAEAIFDKFQQARHGDTLKDRPAGTGLGLSICREIVNHYGGRIWAMSQPGRGSTFSLALPASRLAVAPVVELPAEPGEERLAAIPDEEEAPPLVLVVDDDHGVLAYLGQLFQENGFGVVTATDGRAALEEASRHLPDLITMDLAMPVMDGCDAISRLRADPALRHIPIIVLTAMPGKDQAGGDLALNKPVDEESLLNGARLLTRRMRGSDATSVEPTLGGVPCLVLADPDVRMDVPVPATISTGEVFSCTREEMLARVRGGFQGLVVVPAELLYRLDNAFLGEIARLQVLILPMEKAGVASGGADRQTREGENDQDSDRG